MLCCQREIIWNERGVSVLQMFFYTEFHNNNWKNESFFITFRHIETQLTTKSAKFDQFQGGKRTRSRLWQSHEQQPDCAGANLFLFLFILFYYFRKYPPSPIKIRPSVMASRQCESLDGSCHFFFTFFFAGMFRVLQTGSDFQSIFSWFWKENGPGVCAKF